MLLEYFFIIDFENRNEKLVSFALEELTSIGIHYNVGKSVLDYITNKDDFVFTDGYVKLPKKTGLGVDINKELVMEENKTPHHWKNPVWRHKDGSIAEW